MELPNSECVGKSALISACFEWNEHHNKQGKQDEVGISNHWKI